MVSNTMDPSYWLNWRFLLCAIWVLSSMAVASILIWKYEGSKTDGTEGREAQPGKMGILYEDEAWRPCLRTIHPVWLLVFRVIAFFVFVALLVVTIVVDGASILYYYTHFSLSLNPSASSRTHALSLFLPCTRGLRLHARLSSFLLLPRSQAHGFSRLSSSFLGRRHTDGFRRPEVDGVEPPHSVRAQTHERWTFMLVTIYFGLGLLLSAYGCYHYIYKVSGDRTERMRLDSEHSSYISSMNGETENGSHSMKNPMYQDNQNIRRPAGFGGYLFQIIYQTNAGAVMLTDFVFWLIIFPFLAVKDYDLNFLQIGMHSINAVFLLGDTALNCLQFPWFRIAYFLLWTSIYVLFQWIFHICKSFWWPYPFLDLSSAHAPIWYFAVAVFHVPCYALFSLITKLKHSLLMRWFPQSYHLASLER